jgi:methylmalonyl-CoA/ethylmalonyl-CoA epimerase
MPITSVPDFHLDQIAQISINAHDLKRAEAFYRDKLGIKHLFTVPNMAFFDCGGIRLMLGIPSSPDLDHPSSILYFKVKDIHDRGYFFSDCSGGGQTRG